VRAPSFCLCRAEAAGLPRRLLLLSTSSLRIIRLSRAPSTGPAAGLRPRDGRVGGGRRGYARFCGGGRSARQQTNALRLMPCVFLPRNGPARAPTQENNALRACRRVKSPRLPADAAANQRAHRQRRPRSSLALPAYLHSVNTASRTIGPVIAAPSRNGSITTLESPASGAIAGMSMVVAYVGGASGVGKSTSPNCRC